MSARTAAKAKVIEAALRVLSIENATWTSPYTDAESEYADEQLALAARYLTEATNDLPESEQPVGWKR